MNTNGIPCIVTLLNLMMSVIAYPYQRHTDKHIIDMNPDTHPSLRYEALKIEVTVGEFMEISCPQYDLATPLSETFRYYLFDMHDAESFESCDITDKQKVLSCDTPFDPTKLTMKFQKMSPYPFGFTFKEGATYYYTAIPVGEEDCKHAMRLVVDVLKRGVLIPPIRTLYKEIDTPTPSASTSKTTTTTTTKLTTKSTVTPKSLKRTTTTGSATQSTRILPLIVLLLFITSWINW